MLRKSILLIDSSQVLMDITKKILERSGFSVRCAVGTSGAREQLMDFTPNMMVLGNELPDGDALSFCGTLRSQYGVPIMFMSNSKEDELPALRSGASDFLKKPFDYEIFKARIAVLLNAKIQETADEPNRESNDKTTGSNEPIKDSTKAATTRIAEKKTIPIRFKYAAAAAILIVAAILVGVFLLAKSSLNITDIPDGNVPLSEFNSPNELTIP